MNAQCFWLSSQSGQTQITVGQKHWCCAGGRRWCGAGSPSALIVLLCVWCVAGIGARAHRVSDEERFLWLDNPSPKVGPHARACEHTRPRHRRGVAERLSGLCKVYHPKRWPAEGAVLFRPIMWLYSASVVLVWDSFLPFTLLWPYSSKVHLVLATALFVFRFSFLFLFFSCIPS